MDLRFRRRLKWYRKFRAQSLISPPGRLIVPTVQRECPCGKHNEWTSTSAKSAKPIRIVFGAGTEQLGSIRLRGFQAGEFLVSAGYRGPVILESLQSCYREKPSGSIILVLKTGLKDRYIDALRSIKRRNLLLFDLVDGKISPEVEKIADGFICSSKSELNYRLEAGQAAKMVHHAIDVRLTSPSLINQIEFSVGYYGAPENGLFLDAIPSIKRIPYDKDRLLSESKTGESHPVSLASISHHYTIRNWLETDGFKPLTKAFVAAWLRASVIASRDDPEAPLILGNEFPYLANSSSLQDIEEIIAYAESTHGSDVANRALKAVGKLRQLSCPMGAAIALGDAVHELDHQISKPPMMASMISSFSSR